MSDRVLTVAPLQRSVLPMQYLNITRLVSPVSRVTAPAEFAPRINHTLRRDSLMVLPDALLVFDSIAPPTAELHWPSVG